MPWAMPEVGAHRCDGDKQPTADGRDLDAGVHDGDLPGGSLRGNQLRETVTGWFAAAAGAVKVPARGVGIMRTWHSHRGSSMPCRDGSGRLATTSSRALDARSLAHGTSVSAGMPPAVACGPSNGTTWTLATGFVTSTSRLTGRMSSTEEVPFQRTSLIRRARSSRSVGCSNPGHARAFAGR